MSDDDASSDAARSKVELDVEKHLLGTTVQLADGTEGLVFSRGPKNESQMFLYNCHLCGVPNLPGERCLQTHIAGRKHQLRMQQPSIDPETFRAPLVHKPKIQMNIAPGEPIPPGFENEVKPVAEIQASFDKFRDESLVGLEYVIELTKSYEKEPNYVCILCDKRGDPRTITRHLISFNHRLKFLEKHYQAAVKELGPYRYDPHARNIIPKIVQDICDAVEKHHGRLTPSVYDNEEYSRSRGRILQEIISEKHFDERHGPNFVNVIDKKKIQDNILYEQSLNDPPKLGKGIDTEKKRGHSSGIEKSSKRYRGANSDFSRRDRRNSLDSISSISSSSIEDFRGGGHVTRSSHGRRRSKSRSRDRDRDRDRHSHSRSYRSRSRSRVKRSFSISPISDRFIRRRKKRSQSPAYRFVRIPRTSPPNESKRFGKESRKRTLSEERKKEKSNWEKYRRAVEEGALNLDKALKDHEKNPEKHPLYPDEWKKFWNRRYRELQAEKKDPTKHDFKPEWIVFWTKRMKELHEDALEKMKSEIRKKFNLPEEKDSVKAKNTEPDAKSIKSDKLHVIDISDDDSISLHSIGKSSAKNDASKRSTSPISDDFDPKERSYSSKEKEKVKERDRDRGRYSAADEYYYSTRGFYPPSSSKVHYGYRTMDTKCYPKYEPEQKEDEKDDGPLTVVAVLRLLTALEEHLGSLGPKINDLLAKALALEKVKGNSADELLLNEDNSVFFETVKEKLKGQLIAGVLDQHKIKAVKKAIKDIAAIIHQVNANAKKTEKEEVENKDKMNKTAKPESPVKLDEFDRHLVASKLAAALVMENKTDVSTKQMDQLINVFILMVKLAKDRKSIVKVTDMLEELHIEIEKPVKRQPIVEKILSVASSIAVKDEDESVPQTSMGSLESLTDSDLQILLQNFKHLSSEEQHHLIAHLKKLETVDPMRVEKLRKFVDISDLKRDKSKSPDPKSDSDFFSKKQTTKSKNDDENVRMQLAFDSDDDDDYNFDDVVKAASNNLKEKETPSNTSSFRQDSLQRERDEEISNMSKSSNLSKTSSVNAAISDTKNLIASLMGSLQKNNAPYNSNGNNFSSIPTIVGRQIQLSPKAATAVTSTDGVYPGMETNRNNIVSNTTASNTSVMLTTDSTNAKPRVNPGNVNQNNMNPNMHMNMNTMNPNMNSNMNPNNPYQNYTNAFNAQMNFQQQTFPQMQQYPIAQQQQQTAMNSGSNLFQQLFNQTQQQMYGQTELDQRRFF